MPCALHNYSICAIVFAALGITCLFSPTAVQQGQCRFNKSYNGASEAGIVSITSGNESDLRAAVATAGPISVAIDGSSNAFRVSGDAAVHR